MFENCFGIFVFLVGDEADLCPTLFKAFFFAQRAFSAAAILARPVSLMVRGPGLFVPYGLNAGCLVVRRRP